MPVEGGWFTVSAVSAVISVGSLLTAFLLSRLSRSRSHSSKEIQEPPNSEEAARMKARRHNGVRALLVLEEGFGLSSLPNGVFGFTFAAAYDDSPVFRDGKGSAFEVHKLRDGTSCLLGFVSDGQAELIGAATREVHVSLHPRASEHAPVLVCLPSSRIARYKDYAAGESAAMEIMVVPPGLAAHDATPPSFRLEPPIPAAV